MWVWSAVPALVAGGACLWFWWRAHPSTRPFAQRVWIDAPHPFVTPRRVRHLLAPVAGERMLELGVGSGRYGLPLAPALGPHGMLTVVDLHRDMLELTMGRAREQRLHNVAAVRADGTALPLPTGVFDAAYAVSVLGQVPNPPSALVELRRVVRPGGRVVVGEFGYDPHGVYFRDLCRRAADAGLDFDRRVGSVFGYVARFQVSE